MIDMCTQNFSPEASESPRIMNLPQSCEPRQPPRGSLLLPVVRLSVVPQGKYLQVTLSTVVGEMQ